MKSKQKQSRSQSSIYDQIVEEAKRRKLTQNKQGFREYALRRMAEPKRGETDED